MSLTSLVRRGACALALSSLLAALTGARGADVRVPEITDRDRGGALAAAGWSSEPTPPLSPTGGEGQGQGGSQRPDDRSEPVELPEQVVRLPRAQASDATASATVVQADAFAGEAKAVAELVATAPGVSVRDQGGLGQLATVSIRGASADGVRVLLDGLPLNTAAGGGADLSRIPRHWVSSLEIVRGAEGARFGAGALGGVVNVVTRPAGGDAWSAEVGGGSFRTYTVGADASTGGDGWGLAAALSLDGTRGDFPYRFDPEPTLPSPTVELTRDHGAAGAGGVLVKGFARRGGGRWDALVQLSGGEREVPGNTYVSSTGSFERDGRIGLVLRHARPGPLESLTSATLSLRGDGLDVRGATGDVSQRGLGGSLRLEASGSAGPLALDLGASGGGERLGSNGLAAAHGRAEGAAWASAELQVLAGRLRVAPAVRAEAVGPFHGLSAKLGASLALGGPLSLRASAGRTFRAPSFAELYLAQALLRPNPDLAPERGTSGDATLVAEGRLGLASLGAFASLYEDLIVYRQVFRAFQAFNDERALVRGLEVEVATAPVGPLRLRAQLAGTLQQSRTLRGSPAEVGNALPRRPGTRLFARLAGERGPVEAHLELVHLGRQWLDPLERTSIPRATTANAGLAVRLARNPEVRLHLEVRNALDTRALEDGFGQPLPGQTVMVTLRTSSPTR